MLLKKFCFKAFFPIFTYVVLSTSRHNSVGSFTVIAVMVGRVVLHYTNSNIDESSTAIGNGENRENPISTNYTPLQVLSVLCFVVGIIHVSIKI
jgi:solute carrier family 26 protein